MAQLAMALEVGGLTVDAAVKDIVDAAVKQQRKSGLVV
jgi:hypothetical protein